MPLWSRKRKDYSAKEKIVPESSDVDEERPQQGKAPNAQRRANTTGAKANKDAIFAAGRFHDLGLAPALSDHIHDKLSFSAPTLIQKSAIPLILSGRDALVNADTGTGKTMVYLAPIINALQSYEPRITRNEGTMGVGVTGFNLLGSCLNFQSSLGKEFDRESLTDEVAALVLVPTRELCLQVCAVAEQVVHRFHWLVPGCVMGGENRSKEKARLRKGITILVATPGRLLDHLKNTASFRHDRLRWLVFDEADRLLDLGFEKDIESILEVLGSRDDNNRVRQHVLLSATLNERVEQLAALSLHNPATVGLEEAMPVEGDSPREVGNGTLRTQSEFQKHERNLGDAGPSDGYTEYRIPSQLVQSFLKVPCSLRLVALLGLLQQKSQGNSSCKLVVFFSTCDAVDFHYTIVNEFRWSPTPWKDTGEKDERKLLGCEVCRLHGSMAQKDRTEAYSQFGKSSSAILLCTDVAARGLDFQNVSGIVQYEPPGDAAEYVHRVGRTARLGQKGEAILFLQPSEAEYMEELKKHGVSLQELSLPKLLDGLQDRRGKRDDSFSVVEMHPLAGLMQKALDAFVAAKPDARLLAVDAFRSYVRAYAAHRGELKSIFQVRKLHLGHVAKSFGLRDAPSLFGKSVNKQSLKKEKDRNVKKRIRKKRRLTPGAVED